MNYREGCRTCLGRGKEMRHINATISISGTEVRLSDILHNFYDFEVSPDNDFSENICIHCVHQLTLTYSFKTLIEASTKTLEENSTLLNNSDIFYECNYESDYKPSKPKRIKSFQPRHLPNSDTIRPIKSVTKSRSIIINTNTEFDHKLFCVECKAEFLSRKTLCEHCTNNHPVKSLTGRDCEYCSEKFEDFRELLIHRKLHLKPYLCQTCWGGFYTEEDFHQHLCSANLNRRQRSSEKTLHQCDQCGKSYPQGYIKVHMMTHGNELRYSCKYCPKKFKVANGLNSHVLWNHKRTRNHKCEECNATFISASARSTHVRKNHLKEKKYGCESCSKRFFSKSELQRHNLTHTGEKNFHCHMCEKSYQTRYGLNVHLKSHPHVSVNMLGREGVRDIDLA